MIPNQNEGIHLIASVRRLHTLRAGQARAVPSSIPMGGLYRRDSPLLL
jgi:hypothetical protein